jgi:hypothetical protein
MVSSKPPWLPPIALISVEVSDSYIIDGHRESELTFK